MAWRYTPRELQGWMDFHNRVDVERDIGLLHLMATANSGDWKFINKRIDQMKKLI